MPSNYTNPMLSLPDFRLQAKAVMVNTQLLLLLLKKPFERLHNAIHKKEIRNCGYPKDYFLMLLDLETETLPTKTNLNFPSTNTIQSSAKAIVKMPEEVEVCTKVKVQVRHKQWVCITSI